MALNFFGIELGDWVAIIALLVSAIVPSVLFFFGRRRGTRSEQFRFSLQIWDRIAAQSKILDRRIREEDREHENTSLQLQHALETMRTELKFFVYLAEKGEINDPDVREYYRIPLSLILIGALGLKTKYSKRDGGVYIKYFTQDIINLIEKYHKVIGRMKEFRGLSEGRFWEAGIE